MSKEMLEGVMIMTNKECTECKGEGYFSNQSGSDWEPCEVCNGEGEPECLEHSLKTRSTAQ